METTLPRLWSVQDVALWLTCPTRQVIRWAKAGQMPSIILPDGERVFDPAELANWLATRRRKENDLRLEKIP
jgi:hypothetical protein